MKKSTPQDHPIKHCERCGVIYKKKHPHLTETSKYCEKCCRLGPWNKGKKRGKPFTPRDKLDKKALSVKPESMMEKVRETLKGRYFEEKGHMYLNGRPASLGEVVLAANKIRHKNGAEQLGKNPAWKIVVEVQKEV